MAQAPSTRPSLIARLRDPGDAPAWGQFVALYGPLIHGFARKKGLQDADAADLTQDALQAVAQSIARLDYDPRRGSFRGWLFTLVRNKVHDFQRRRDRLIQGTGDTDQLAVLQEQPAPADDDNPWWDQELERRLLHWAADQVRPDVAESTWRAFWLTAVEGQTAPEAARTLGLSVASVYMAKSRVLARLKELIDGLEGGPPHV